jgi:hypothetical protein
MTDSRKNPASEPMPSPTWKPSPPEMELEPIPVPERADDTPRFEGDDLPSEGLVPTVSSTDEENIDADEALPDEVEEAILLDDPERGNTRFDEEMPKDSR